ncbi:MAG: alpha/beta hydrolase [Cyanobacteria bacterium P01_D01_bin.1]
MRLHTEIQGAITGYPALCLHGHPGSSAAMSVFTDALTALGFRTYAPDLRGYGQSKATHPFQMMQHLDDLEELLARYGIRQCLVLGWSLGGILAMELALRRADVVQGLVLVGTAARPRGSHPPITLADNVMTGMAGLVNYALPGWDGAIALGKQSLLRYLVCNHTPEAYTYIAREGAPAVLRTSHHATKALNKEIQAGYDRLQDLEELQIPALMLCGECDRHITAKSSLETARTLPNCESRCYPNTAHLFPWEIPARMTADIQDWLSRQEGYRQEEHGQNNLGQKEYR